MRLYRVLKFGPRNPLLCGQSLGVGIRLGRAEQFDEIMSAHIDGAEAVEFLTAVIRVHGILVVLVFSQAGLDTGYGSIVANATGARPSRAF
jgi:hypothetical protein